jgi:glycosyltransferase involved in cell wall biosynthesis
VVFVVNGPHDSAMGYRARAFASRLADAFDTRIAYRLPNRVLAIVAFRSFLRDARPDVTYVLDMSFSGVVAAALYRAEKRNRNRIVIDTGDAIHALAESIGRSRAGVLLTAALQGFSIRLADQLVVRGTRHREWLAAHRVEAVLIPDGVEVDRFCRRDARDLRGRLGLDDVLVIGVLGTSIWSPRLGICQGWDLVELIHLLRNAPVKGLVIGDGSGVARLKTRCDALGLRHRVLFLGRIPYEELPVYLSAMDVCLSTQTNDLAGQVRTTGKLPLYLATGRYILASRVGEAAFVLPDEMLVDYAGTVDPTYPSRLADRVRHLLANPERLKLGEVGSEIARCHFNYDLLAKRVGTLFTPHGSWNRPRRRSA